LYQKREGESGSNGCHPATRGAVLADEQPRPCAGKAHTLDVRAEMRWVGISLCVLSAALTLVSAAVVAIRL
jgi:hypothetical protein